MTDLARNLSPILVSTPQMRSCSIKISVTSCWKISKFGWFSSAMRTAWRYNTRSAWARVARTAGPLLLFKVRNWIPALSAACAIKPPIASTSFTKWPLPIPPIAGLHDICPRVSTLCVNNRVFNPIRAGANAASVPAWPPPTTITS